MKQTLTFVFVLSAMLLDFTVCAQTGIDSTRITSWSKAGAVGGLVINNTVNLLDFGADATGVLSSDQAINQAIASLNGPGEIYIPAGNYLFNTQINLPDSILISGEPSFLDSGSATTLMLNPISGQHGFLVKGSVSTDTILLGGSPVRGQTKIFVPLLSKFPIGCWARLVPTDEAGLLVDAWAYGHTGQLFQVIGHDNGQIVLSQPIRRDYASPPKIMQVFPKQQVHFHCLSLQRVEPTDPNGANIFFQYAVNCTVKGIYSYLCTNSHFDIRTSAQITVENCGFRDAFSYGSGGEAYGVLVHAGSSDCLIRHNTFNHLRHAMLLQSGANGNVFAYNYSQDPYWTGVTSPSNSAGDAVLHGNWPYMNLFEGNIVQNIVIDNAHGMNGPHNTFFRNRAELYGLFMSPIQVSNNQNFIANQIINTSSSTLGLFYVQGTGHWSVGNMVKGTVLPANTTEPSWTSLCGYQFPSYYYAEGEIPPMQNSFWESKGDFIEAKHRVNLFNAPSLCEDIPYVLPPAGNVNNWAIKPLDGDWQVVDVSSGRPFEGRFQVSDIAGQVLQTGEIQYNGLMDISELPFGVYFLTVRAGGLRTWKIVQAN
jgi:Pectate lyase superfamily protein